MKIHHIAFRVDDLPIIFVPQQMDEYFHHLELIVKEGKLSARILFILQRFVFHRKVNASLYLF